MSERKHTPGPWYVSDPPGNKCGVRARQGYICHIVGTGPNEANNARREANTRLIAASPDLFEALQRLTREADLDGLREKAGWDCWLNMADAAIAKARGES